MLYFRENRERCRAVSYAVFDYHPFMEAVDLDYRLRAPKRRER